MSEKKKAAMDEDAALFGDGIDQNEMGEAEREVKELLEK